MMNNELFDKGKEFLRSMTVEQLEAFKAKIEKDLRLEWQQGTHEEQKAYTPMPWMIPNMERGIQAATELLEEKKQTT